jgi:hypothetical protein
VCRRAVESLGTVAVSDKWSIVVALHCSRIVAAYLHALQALTALSARMSCRAMMILMSGAQAGLLDFFLFLRHAAHREPRDTWQRRSPHQTGGEVQRHRTRGSTAAHLSQEAMSRAIGHVAALESTSTGRRDPEP